MVIMALDHVRDYTNVGYVLIDPTNLQTTTPFLFFTRWITHFCAPVFVFLAGTSAYLYGSKKNSKEVLAKFLLSRGLWLVFIELTVVNFGWTFDVGFSVNIFQVIWAIGICMILLSGLIYLPKKILISLGAIIVFGHNLLDPIQMQGTEFSSLLWYLTHQFSIQMVNNTGNMLYMAYPFLPWLGIIILGYSFGQFYENGADPTLRKKWLLRFGIAAVVLFALLRFVNIYGDLVPWSQQDELPMTIVSFFNLTKYPPSLLYILMTLGPAMLFLYTIESVENGVTRSLLVFGRVPFLFYIIHIYLIHLIGLIGLIIQGENWRELIFTPSFFINGYLVDKGFGLGVTYAVWLAVILLLFPVCNAYMRYKANNREKWWLSYL